MMLGVSKGPGCIDNSNNIPFDGAGDECDDKITKPKHIYISLLYTMQAIKYLTVYKT